MFKDVINQWDTVSSSFQEHSRTVACKAMVLQHQDVICMCMQLEVLDVRSCVTVHSLKSLKLVVHQELSNSGQMTQG